MFSVVQCSPLSMIFFITRWMGLGFLFSSLNSFTNPLTIMYNSRAFKETIWNICPALGNN